MHILVLEAYDGGSHQRFLDGLIKHSGHQYSRISLPARKWKWRMRGSALYFAQLLQEKISKYQIKPPEIDLIFTSDMTAVADLRGLLPAELKNKPIVCYFHENQLTYPLIDESERDYQYGFTNITSCLAAEAVWFNSEYHLDSFLTAVTSLLKRMPDFVPTGIEQTIRERSKIMPLGLEPDLFEYQLPKQNDDPPTVLWNHRWEYDKNPEEFFEVLFDLNLAGEDFRLIVAGESFRQAPEIFASAEKLLARKIIHFGYVANRREYLRLLAQSDIVVSTAIHEFFGLAVLEGIAMNCYPLLPRRLSYPELIPGQCHGEILYEDSEHLRGILERFCRGKVPPLPEILQEKAAFLSWRQLAPQYDSAFVGV